MKHLIPDEIAERLVWKEPRANNETVEELQFPHVVSIKPLPCSDCNRPCKHQRVINGRKNVTPYTHWRYQCNVCMLYLHPETKVFSLNAQDVQNYYKIKNQT